LTHKVNLLAYSVDTVVMEEPTQFGGDSTVLAATMDEVSDVIRWNYTSQTSVLVMRASGRHGNQCGRGLTANIYYATISESYALT